MTGKFLIFMPLSPSLQQNATAEISMWLMLAFYLRVSVKLRAAARWITTETFDSRCCWSASLMPRAFSVISPATGMICREKCGFNTPNLPNSCDTQTTHTELLTWHLTDSKNKVFVYSEIEMKWAQLDWWAAKCWKKGRKIQSLENYREREFEWEWDEN